MAGGNTRNTRNGGTTYPPNMEAIIAQRVADAIAAYEANRASTSNGGGTSQTAGGEVNASRGCTYKEFQSCKPSSFNGTEGAVGLLRWFEKLESVFRICDCNSANRVKFATCTLQDSALTWWNAYAQSVGIDVAYQLPWEDLKNMMTEEYCPRNEIQKLEAEFWNLTMKGNDISSYTTRFQELSLLCPGMITPEYKKVERYIWGLTPQVQGNVTSSKPAHIQGAIRMAHDLVDQVVRRENSGEKATDNKRKTEDPSNRSSSQPPSKKNNTVKAYTAGTGNYNGNKPLCNRCKLHHTGNCTVVCKNCNKIGHQTRDCRKAAPTTNARAAPGTSVKVPNGCFECGDTGHFKKDCPRLTNRNNGGRAQGRAFVLGA